MNKPLSILAFAFALSIMIFAATNVSAQSVTPPTAPTPEGKIRAQGQDVDLDKKKQQKTVSPTAANFDARQLMRNFIRSISAYVRRGDQNFIIITQGGLNLLEKVDAIDTTRRATAGTYIRSIDGIIINGLNFRPPATSSKDFKTDAKEKTELIRLADLGKKRGLRIWVSDFAENAEMVKEAFQLNKAKGYVPFAVADIEFNYNSIPKFPRRPFAENPHNITGLKLVKNFLYLTDSSAYDSQAKFVHAMSGTNFDALIVDVFHRGRRPFKKHSVGGMKYKKLGAKRLVLAYMNIGEAESFRYYFKSGWREGNPPFLGEPIAGNPDKHHIKFWHREWQKMISGNTKSYAYGIVAQGYDGIVIDGVDAYQAFKK